MSAVKSTETEASPAGAPSPPKKRGKIGRVLLAMGAVVALLIIGLAAVVAMQPDQFRVERSAAMAAPPEAVFAQVNDFHNWQEWSPWLDLDPNAKATFEGPESGEGAVFRWAGNSDVGEGSMTILESKPNEFVQIELHFIKPFEDTAITEFKVVPDADGTKVTWSMDGQHNFMSKAMCMLIMDMEKMIGDKYDEGLANMKAIVESPAADPADAPTAEAASSES